MVGNSVSNVQIDLGLHSLALPVLAHSTLACKHL